MIVTTPKQDGFRMPGEHEKHKGTWMLWPMRTDTWRAGAKPAQQAFAQVATAISQFEPVTVCVNSTQFLQARALLPEAVRVVEISSNDAWMRDIGPTFVKNDLGEVRAVQWGFNAWGGLHSGLYFPWDQDQLVPKKIAELEQVVLYDAQFLINEGGAIATDGEGTVIVTEQCILHENRNPGMSKSLVENYLCEYLGAEKVIWIPEGLVGDETDGHIDEVLFFVKPGVLGLTWTDDTSHPQYSIMSQVYTQLQQEIDAKGRSFELHKLHMPQQLQLSKEESAQIDQDPYSFERTHEETFIATYANCYICNGGVIIPSFNDPQDDVAKKQFESLFPDREIVQVYSREIAVGGGIIHCITQQQPEAR